MTTTKSRTSRRFRAVLHMGLFTTVLALAGFDWFVSTTGADDDNRVRNAADAPRPTAVASTRDLTATSPGSVSIGSVECRIVRFGNGYQLQAHNTGRTAQTLELRVDRVEMVGEAYGRMGPMPSVVGTDTVSMRLAPGARAVRALSAAPAAAQAPGAPNATPPAGAGVPTGAPNAPPIVVLGRYRTIDFHITEQGQPASATQILRIADRAAASGVLSRTAPGT